MMKTEHLDNAAVTWLKAAWASAIIGGIGTLSLNEWMTVLGFLVAVIGSGATIYYKHKSDKRQQTLFELRKKRLEDGRSDHAALGDEDPEG